LSPGGDSDATGLLETRGDRRHHRRTLRFRPGAAPGHRWPP